MKQSQWWPYRSKYFKCGKVCKIWRVNP